MKLKDLHYEDCFSLAGSPNMVFSVKQQLFVTGETTVVDEDGTWIGMMSYTEVVQVDKPAWAEV